MESLSPAWQEAPSSSRAAAADPDGGFRTAAWFWDSRSLNTYADADAGNFREVTRRINGGYNGLAAREAYYNRALNVLR